MSGAEPRPQATRGRLRPVPTPDPQPPHNVEAEEAVLGAVLAAGRLLVEVAALVEEADFYRPAHRAIWRAILALADRGEPTDPVTVLGELDHAGELAEVGGGPFLHTLVQAVPTVAHAGHYARLIAEAARRRRVIDLGIRLAHSDADPAVLAHLVGELADTTTASVGERGWEPPIPFGIASGLPAFPVEVLPGWLGEYVAAVATATQTPPDLAGMLALAVLATVAAGAVEVQPRPGWQEPLCVFVAVGMDAGARKSGVFTAMTRPLADFERQQAAAALPGITETATLRRIAEQAAAYAEAAASKAPAGQAEERLAEVPLQPPPKPGRSPPARRPARPPGGGRALRPGTAGPGRQPHHPGRAGPNGAHPRPSGGRAAAGVRARPGTPAGRRQRRPGAAGRLGRQAGRRYLPTRRPPTPGQPPPRRLDPPNRRRHPHRRPPAGRLPGRARPGGVRPDGRRPPPR